MCWSLDSRTWGIYKQCNRWFFSPLYCAKLWQSFGNAHWFLCKYFWTTIIRIWSTCHAKHHPSRLTNWCLVCPHQGFENWSLLRRMVIYRPPGRLIWNSGWNVWWTMDLNEERTKWYADVKNKVCIRIVLCSQFTSNFIDNMWITERSQFRTTFKWLIEYYQVAFLENLEMKATPR